MRTINGIEIDNFTHAYITAALWSSMDDDGEPLDDKYGPEDIDPDTLRRMADDCREFRDMDWDYLKGDAPGESMKRTADIGRLLRVAERRANGQYSADDYNGHDFWLTRERHGAGFWDRGYGKVGDILTEAAHSFGSFDIYLGDDGMIHGS